MHKGTILCQRDSHNVVTATAVLLGRNDQTIELTVNYCKDCKRFFINYISYDAYKNKYGILIGNIVLEDEGHDLTVVDTMNVLIGNYFKQPGTYDVIVNLKTFEITAELLPE